VKRDRRTHLGEGGERVGLELPVSVGEIPFGGGKIQSSANPYPEPLSVGGCRGGSRFLFNFRKEHRVRKNYRVIVPFPSTGALPLRGKEGGSR